MNTEQFINDYKEKSNLELLLILNSEEYSEEAKKVAEDILNNRLRGQFDFQKAWDNEIKILMDRTDKCHICGKDEVVFESDKFIFKNTKESLNLGASSIGLLSFALVGIGFISKNIKDNNSPEFTLKLCSDCANKKTKKKCFYRKEYVEIQNEDYYHHPFFEIFSFLGYLDVVPTKKRGRS